MSRLSYLMSALFISPLTVLGMGQPGLTQALAQSQLLVALQYNPPNRGAPGSTWNAGSRTGPCGDLTAVQPTKTNWGETLKSHPTFGIYVAEPATNLIFELRNERSQEIVHSVTFAQVTGPGISLYTLPDSVPALEPNQYYRWQVSLDCEQFNTANIQYDGDKQVGGMVMRQLANDELQAQLATVPDTDKPALLAAHGLWYDMVHVLMVQHLEQSTTETETVEPWMETWKNNWQAIVSHPMVQLTNLMDAVPIDCCLAADCPSATSSDTRRIELLNSL